MGKSMLGLLVDVETGRVREVIADGSLRDMYRLVRCDCIDISRQVVGGVEVDIVVDDEGMLLDGATPSVVTPYQYLYGNALVLGHDRYDLRGLTREEMQTLMRHVRLAVYDDGTVREVLVTD
jgi:hypothetical protein